MTVEQRLDQLEKRNNRLTAALTMMAMVAITIQLSACGNDSDVSDVKALAGRDLTENELKGANLEGAILVDANLENALNVPELSAKQEEDACRSCCDIDCQSDW